MHGYKNRLGKNLWAITKSIFELIIMKRWISLILTNKTLVLKKSVSDSAEII